MCSAGVACYLNYILLTLLLYKSVSMKSVNLITAICENNGIGLKNALPWRLKKEMQYFTSHTTKTENHDLQNAVVMGRKTWNSVPAKYKPFSDRLNVVISRSQQPELSEGVLHYSSVEEAVNALQEHPKVETIWIIGGKGVYEEALNNDLCQKLYITRVKKNFECDTFFPKFDENNYELINETNVPSDVQEEDGIQYEFKIFRKKVIHV